MDFNFEFDYMNSTVGEWFDKLAEVNGQNKDEDELGFRVSMIDNEFLPRFEAAIYRNLASQMISQSNDAVEFIENGSE